MEEKKKTNKLFILFSSVCLIAVVACLICNFAVSRSVSWSLYVLLSAAFGWAVASPVFLFKKNRVLWILVVISALLVPYLFLLERLTPVKDWFGVLGLPIAVVSVLSFWAAYGVFKFLKVNKWFKCSIVVFLYGVITNTIIEVLVALYTGQKLFTFDNILTFATMIALSGLLFYIGRGHNVNVKPDTEKKTDTLKKP